MQRLLTLLALGSSVAAAFVLPAGPTRGLTGIAMKATAADGVSRSDVFKAAGGSLLGATALLTTVPAPANAEFTLSQRKQQYFRVRTIDACVHET